MLYPRKRLSDITNISFNSFEEELQSDGQEDGHVGSPVMANEYIAKLLKENNVLMRALAERNTEVQKLRMIVVKTSQQNSRLAQAHSHMQAELNLSKDRLKIAQHELVCTSTTLGLKTQELKEHKMLKKNKVVQNISSQEGHIKPIESVAEASQLSPHKKTCLSNRKRPQRSQSLGPKILTNQGVVKEKDDNPRKPLRRKSINPKVELCIPTDDLFEIEKDDNPRKPLRRKSINPKVELCIPTDDLFEIENAKFPICSVYKRESKDESSAIQPDLAVPVASNVNPVNEEVGKENQKFNQLQYEGMRRASLGRPLRKAAERVNSYKELPLKAKLRRSE
ncbi:hypothetical protein HPP92_004610 [Vanilla planifolia]|uniref:Shugoshin C-terminal domain-containing protein n=1 Tax=Vanilla planifolia TaxID=51239 RepID=A0A835VEM1_VANPL|nr:hypothetical protein HPP92_004963 [Vanilla planifolia]KAG0493616.1 hypothetical protein HPP92_004610 [Vanilla planifolia]